MLPSDLQPVAINQYMWNQWHSVAICIGVSSPRPIEQVKFYTAPAGSFNNQGVHAYGSWYDQHDAIVVSETSKYDVGTWRHEMTHAIIKGGANHPAQYFASGCSNNPGDAGGIWEL